MPVCLRLCIFELCMVEKSVINDCLVQPAVPVPGSSRLDVGD